MSHQTLGKYLSANHWEEATYFLVNIKVYFYLCKICKGFFCKRETGDVMQPGAWYCHRLALCPHFDECHELLNRGDGCKQEWLSAISSATGKSYPTQKQARHALPLLIQLPVLSKSHAKGVLQPEKAGHCLAPRKSIYYLLSCKSGRKPCISTEVKYRCGFP